MIRFPLEFHTCRTKESSGSANARKHIVDAAVLLPVRRTDPYERNSIDNLDNLLNVWSPAFRILKIKFITAKRDKYLGRTELPDIILKSVMLGPDFGIARVPVYSMDDMAVLFCILREPKSKVVCHGITENKQ